MPHVNLRHVAHPFGLPDFRIHQKIRTETSDYNTLAAEPNIFFCLNGTQTLRNRADRFAKRLTVASFSCVVFFFRFYRIRRQLHAIIGAPHVK
jgi:hypothetical protein